MTNKEAEAPGLPILPVDTSISSYGGITIYFPLNLDIEGVLKDEVNKVVRKHFPELIDKKEGEVAEEHPKTKRTEGNLLQLN